MNFYAFIPKLLNMSLTAGVAIVFVLLLRLMLKKAPKVISYALWAVVLFRLLCPVSIESSFSLFGLMDAPTTESSNMTTSIEYVPENIVHTEYPAVTLPVPGVSEVINGTLPSGQEQLVADPLEAPTTIVTSVWIAGVLVMAAYSVISYRRLRQKLLTASPLRDNIYLADEIASPFVMGLVRPKIYLPSDMEEREQAYIIRHEQHHIRRGDHIIKALAFLALSIHWFNPLVWVAFIYSNKDMEMSCDEAVVKKMGDGILADYTASLLSLATGKHIIAGMPLAFGEGDTKGRIRNLANWRKPAFWVVMVSIVACLILTICLITNPKGISIYQIIEEDGYTIVKQEQVEVTLSIPKDVLSDSIYTEEGQQFKEKEVIAYQTDETVIFLDEVRVSNESEDLLYFTFGYSLDLPKSGTVIVPFSVIKDGASAAIYPDDSLISDSGTYADAIHMRGEHTGGFAFYVSADACRGATGTMKIKGFGIELTYTREGTEAEMHASEAQYYLLIGADGVGFIQTTFDGNENGGVPHGKGATFEKGQRVLLNTLQGVTDLRGVTITAYGLDGEIIYEFSVPEDATDAEISEIVGSDPWFLAPTSLFKLPSDNSDIPSAEQIVPLNFEINDVFFTYNSKQYDLSKQNEQINEITDFFQIGEYLVLEGHTGPKHNVYCVFNMRTETFEAYISGANLTWYGDDINTAVYSYWSDIFTFDGRCLASYELAESEYIYSLEYSENGLQIEALILSDTGDERTEIIFPNTYIVSYSDVNHNRINERVIVREIHPDQLYELSVVEDGVALWNSLAGLPHVGWNTILLYSEDGQDYLVQYNPTMHQGLGSYICTVFSLDGNKQTVKEEWSVDFELGPEGNVEETVEMTRFAERVDLLMRNSAVLLSTERGILVDKWTEASGLPQLYPVRFDPDEIIRAIEAAAEPTAPQELTANAAAFPTESLEFVFASGAGGWGTYLTLQPDGRFTGDYGDSDMDTRYECKFEGQFADIQQISDYCWAMKLGDVTIEKEEGTTWTDDGIHYIAAGPHGVSGGADFLLYAPGTPADLIPAECRNWWPDAYLWRSGEIDILNGWALCNLSKGTAFFTCWLS